MAFSVQKYFSFPEIYNFAAKKQQKYTDWAASCYSHAYTRLRAVSAFIRRDAFHAGHGFAWSHKVLTAEWNYAIGLWSHRVKNEQRFLPPESAMSL